MTGHRRASAPSMAGVMLLVAVGATAATPVPTDVWGPSRGYESVATGRLASGRIGHTATLLPDGRVLVIGGYESATAEVWDPASGLWSPAGTMAAAREGHLAWLLVDGRVLVTDPVDSAAAPPPEVWSPVTLTFSPATDDDHEVVESEAPVDARAPSRNGASRTTLPDGRVLVAGGHGPSAGRGPAGPILDTAELWDPATGTSTPTASMVVARTEHTATLLQDGRVLLVGSHTHGPDDATAEVFQPVP